MINQGDGTFKDAPKWLVNKHASVFELLFNIIECRSSIELVSISRKIFEFMQFYMVAEGVNADQPCSNSAQDHVHQRQILLLRHFSRIPFAVLVNSTLETFSGLKLSTEL